MTLSKLRSLPNWRVKSNFGKNDEMNSNLILTSISTKKTTLIIKILPKAIYNEI